MLSLLFFLSALGVFNGLILSFYLFFITPQKRLSKYLLGALVLALSIRIGKSVFLYFDRGLPKIYLQIGLSACFFIGPFLYFYLKSVLFKKVTIPKTWQWTLLGLLILIIGIGAYRPYQQFPIIWNHYVIYLIYWEWLAFIGASFFLLLPIFKKAWKDLNAISNQEKWLVAIFLANLIILTTFYAALYGVSSAYYISGPLVFSFFLYLAIFGYFYIDNSEFSSQKPLKKYANKKIETVEAKRLIAQLDHLMLEKKLYTNPKLKLKEVAQELAISPHLLSQLLNDNLGKSFSTYVNEHRTQAACHLLMTAHNLSLEGIGYEAGFNSKSAFFTTFKKIMQTTPALYKRQIASK